MSAEPRTLHPVIRPLHPGDLDAVVSIEEAAYPFPWSRGIFSECLRVGYGCLGVFLDHGLAGYVIFNWGAGESHLLNLCVHPGHQGRGLGSLLLTRALERVRAMDCHAMYLEVRPSNPEAAGLYERRGFRVVGRRPGYYRSAEGREDAIIMRLDFAGLPPPVESGR